MTYGLKSALASNTILPILITSQWPFWLAMSNADHALVLYRGEWSNVIYIQQLNLTCSWMSSWALAPIKCSCSTTLKWPFWAATYQRNIDSILYKVQWEAMNRWTDTHKHQLTDQRSSYNIKFMTPHSIILNSITQITRTWSCVFNKRNWPCSEYWL